MAVFRVQAIAGDPLSWLITFASPFAGTEGLFGSVVTGTGEAALVAPVLTWAPGQTAGAFTQAIASLSAVQTGTLAPGGYIVQVTVAGSAAPIAWGSLVVYPGAGTSPVLRTLVTPGQALLIAPDMGSTQEDLDSLAGLLAIATATVERYCRRPLALTAIDRVYRPGRTRRVYLHSWPIAPGARLTTDWMTVITITNAAPSLYPVATASWTPAGAGQLTPASLTLATVDSAGASASVLIPLATMATIQALANAINIAGHGWQATPAAELGSRLSTDLLGDPGQHGCAGQAYEIGLYARDLARYSLDDRTGVIELTEHRPEAFRYPDRAWGTGYGWAWSSASDPRRAGVRVTYRAGYACLAADLAAGLTPVPDDLAAAVVMTAHALGEGIAQMGPVIEQAVKDRSYKLRDAANLIPAEARAILDSGYMNNRLH